MIATTPHPRHGDEFDAVDRTDPEWERKFVRNRLDRLSDLAECEYLADDVRELLRWAASELAVWFDG